MVRIEHYMDLVGDDVISEIYRKATPLSGKSVVHINSTYYGGGVAEILKTLIPLLNDVGMDAGWRVLHGRPDFFSLTKDFHNALQGESDIDFDDDRISMYRHTNEDFSVYTHLDHDWVVIHDPQPLPLIKYYRKRQPWFWRCHIDLSQPNREIWDLIKRYILRYDKVIVSNDRFKNPSLPVDQTLIYPAIDPLSTKNREMDEEEVNCNIDNMKIPTDKPLITQVSRFDKWKDPIGVINVFKKVKERTDCRLVLCGSMASDDPEGYKMYDMVKNSAGDLIEKGDIIIKANETDIGINALQRASSVIVQKSHKEGFGLTVTEALWKRTPVVCSNVGGLAIQVKDGENGYVLDPEDDDGFVERIVHILKNPDKMEKMSDNARENVRKKFLVTRLMLDYMNLFMKNKVGDLV